MSSSSGCKYCLQESGVSVAAATTSVQCPHIESVVCTIWCLVQNYKGKYCNGPTTTTTTTTTTTSTTTPTTTTTSTSTIPMNTRPVALEQYPGCPAKYQSSSNAMVLCVMWVELNELEQNVGSIPQNGLGYIPVTCQFSQYQGRMTQYELI